jgi:RNA polymerase sigma-70 factor (ECF subfamily)
MPDNPRQSDPLPTPASQLERLETPENRAFGVIYAENFGFVWRCLRSLGVAPAVLDDATQDVFLVVHRRLASYRPDVAVRTWLYGIVKRVASNARRSQKRKGAHQALGVEPPSVDRGPLQRAEDAELAAFVHRFMDQLSEPKRDLFLLAIVEELAIPEVAATLSIPLNTAYSRLRSVRQEFQRALERERCRER